MSEIDNVFSTAGSTGDTTKSGPRRYFGCTARASGGAITVNVYDGASTAGELIDTLQVADGAEVTHWFGPNGITCKGGIFVDGVTNCAAYVVRHTGA